MKDNDLFQASRRRFLATRRLNRRRDAGAVIVNAAPCDCGASGD